MAHSHEAYEETIYGLEGVLTMSVEGIATEVGPDYFRDIASVVEAAAGGPPDLAAIGAAMKRHGLTPAP